MSRKKKEVDAKQDKTIKDLRDVVDFTNETNKEQDKAIKSIEESVNMSFKNDAEAHSLNQEQNVRLNEINAKIAKFDEGSYTLSFPLQIKLPNLMARAITLLTGSLPEDHQGVRTYQLFRTITGNEATPSSIMKQLNQK